MGKKLVIQVPCHNEEECIPRVLGEMPRDVPGFDEICVLVVDDGSTDGTVEAAREAGADRIVKLVGHHGLARTFRTGLDTALDMGADVIVNIDADGQYDPQCISEIVAPVLAEQADMVIGNRDPGSLPHFSATKRFLQRIGARVVSRIAGVDVPDVTSGFRAFSRKAAFYLNVFSGYTYTLETIIQAGQGGLKITSVPVQARKTERPSRLMRSTSSYVAHSILTILRTVLLYKSVWLFLVVGALLGAAGAVLVFRFMYFYFTVEGQTGYVQSLVFGGTLLLLGFQFLLLGVLADLISTNRRLHEEAMAQLRRLLTDRRNPVKEADQANRPQN